MASEAFNSFRVFRFFGRFFPSCWVIDQVVRGRHGQAKLTRVTVRFAVNDGRNVGVTTDITDFTDTILVKGY